MITKNKTLSLGISAIIVLLSVMAFKPEDKKPETIIVRSTQLYTNKKGKSFIRVFKGNTVIEKTEIENWDIDNDEVNYDKTMSTVLSFEKLGYEILSHTEGNYSTYGYVNTFIMIKK